MSALIGSLIVLAQEAAPDQNPMGGFILTLVVCTVFMLIMQSVLLPSPAKEKKKREALITSLKKNDPVVTAGGILGTFVSASEDKTEVTIKVDDNTRLKIQASAIKEVLARKGDAETKKEGA